MRNLFLVALALTTVTGCKKACPMGGSPLTEVIAPFDRFKAYPAGMKACSASGGLDTPTFFFEGGDLAAHAQTMDAFFTSKGYVMKKNGVRAPTKGDFEAAVAGHGSRPRFDLLYKASDANVFADGSLGADRDGKYTMVHLTIYDCAQPPVDGMMAALCKP